MCLVVLIILVKGNLQTNPCRRIRTIIPTVCRCLQRGKEKVKMKCVNTDKWSNFTFIPTMPNITSHLYVRGFRLTNVSKETFQNLVNIKLREITLVNNNILKISSDAFQEMKSLKNLEISREKLLSKEEISKMFFHLPRKIEELKFSSNTWVSPPPTLIGLHNTSLKRLILSYNYLHSLKGEWFSNLTKLSTLDVQFNGLTVKKCNFTGLERIRNLFLNGNWFKAFPNFCDYPSWNLTRLHFQYNKLTEFRPSYFQCLPRLTHLYLNGHAIRKLYNNTFSNLTSLRELYIQRLAGQLFQVDARAFESKTLVKLVFTSNWFVFRSSPVYFKYCPKLTTLDISFNDLSMLTEDKLLGMLKPLENLTTLWIRNTRLRFLPRHLLKHLPLLTKLNASENQLNGSWNGLSVFGNSSTLKYLNLSANGIEKITKENFPLTLLNGMGKGGLDLSFNRFSCNCDDALWFYKWMHAHKDKFASLTGIVCHFDKPVQMRTAVLFDLKERELCPINPAVLIAIISSCSVLFGGFMILAVLFKLRWNIRHCLYVITYRKKGYETISNDPDFKYDVFLVYADNDSVFVFDTVVPYLEAKAYSLCVRSRDFEAGKVYCDNIVDNMNLSRRILLVLSNNFAKSKWCEFQLNFAYNRCLDEKINNIVVTVLEEISFKYLSNTLKVLLTSYEYALWSKSDEMGQALFWEKVLRKLQFRKTHIECANGVINVI